MRASKGGGGPSRRSVALFLCECGPNIAGAINLARVAEIFAQDERLAAVERCPVMCSPDGLRWFAERLGVCKAERLVIAGCSPREHLHTFQGACRAAGRNPYLLQLVNLREQCGWVTPDREAATAKSLRLINGGIARALEQQPLSERQVDCNPDVLVIGAGIAGLRAAKLLADADRQVVLVERAPCVGGRVARLAELYPGMACASCLLEGLVDEVVHHPRIELFTCAELSRLAGSYGQFRATIRQQPRGVDPELCYGCPSCLEACPVSLPNAFDEGLSRRHAIYLPYAGAVPNVPAVDWQSCLRHQGMPCEACAAACPFGAIDLTQGEQLVSREVGAVIVASGAELRELSGEPRWRGDPAAVISTMGLERLLDSSGPTSGAVVLPDGTPPRSVALVHCAGGSDGGRAASCSAVCCLALTKYRKQLHEKLLGARLVELLWERCTPGKGAGEFARTVQQETGAVEQLRLQPGDRLELAATEGQGADGAGRCTLRIRGAGGQVRTIAVDLVVLAPPLGGAPGAEALAQLINARTGAEGFFEQPEPQLAPYLSTVEGVLLAGCAAGPKDVQDSASEGAAAAARVLSGLIPGRKLEVVPIQAQVTAERCGGCKTCLATCPFGAIVFDPTRLVAEVDGRLCRGCGSCAARCPSGAIAALGFTDDQLDAEIAWLLAAESGGGQ